MLIYAFYKKSVLWQVCSSGQRLQIIAFVEHEIECMQNRVKSCETVTQPDNGKKSGISKALQEADSH